MKVLVKVRDLRIVQHAVHLGGEDFGVLQAALRGEVVQLVVGHGGPEEIGEAGCQFVLAEGIDAGLLAAVLELEEEIGSGEDGLERQLDALFERVAALGGAIVEGHERRDVGGFHRAPVGFAQEGAQDLFGGLARLKRLAARLGAEQAVVQREFFGRGVGWLLLHGEADDGNRRRFGNQREHAQTAREPHLNAVDRGTRGAAPASALALPRAAEAAAALLHGERHTGGAIHFEGERAHAILALDGGLHEVVAIDVDGDRGGEFLAGREVARGGVGGRLRGQQFGGRECLRAGRA